MNRRVTFWIISSMLLVSMLSFSGTFMVQPTKILGRSTFFSVNSHSKNGDVTYLAGDKSFDNFKRMHKHVNSNSIVLEFHFLSPIVTEGLIYDSISTPRLPRYGAPGEPILPFKTVQVLIPQGKNIESVDVAVGNRKVLEGSFNVEYGKTPVPVSSCTTVVDQPNQAIYNSATLFPGVWYSWMSEQHLRGYKITVVKLHPVQYVPRTGKISYVETMTLTVNMVRGNMSPLFRNLPQDKDLVLNIVDNPGGLDSYAGIRELWQPTTLVDPSDSYDYVIVTNNTLSSAFQLLIDWKIQKGLNATIVLLEDILDNAAYHCDGLFGDGCGTQFNDTQAHIRNFIKDAYLNWKTEYVLLGGDDEIIPARGVYVYAECRGEDCSDYNIPCDMYYGTLDGSWDSDNDTIFGEAVYDWSGPENGTEGEEADFFAEVYVGRATVDTLEEAANFVNKTLEYEQNAEAEYLKKALMIGQTLDDDTEGGNGKDLVTNIIPQYTTRRLYDRDGTFNSSTVINEMNKGTHIINHDGHANSRYVMGLTDSEVNGLTNIEFFMAYSMGCYSAAFDEATSGTQESIAEHFIFNPHGAFAYIGNSRYGWYSPGSTNGPGDRYDRSFFNVLSDGIRNVGKTLQYSKELLFSEHIHRWTYFTLNLLGDPETELVTDIMAPTAHFQTRTDLLTYPHHEGVVALNGTAKRGPSAGTTFDNYTIKFGVGINPASWSSTGISLTNNGETEIVNGPLASWNTSLVNVGIYTLRLTVYDLSGNVGEDWIIVQVGANLKIQAYNALGQPAEYTQIYGAGGEWIYETTEANGKLEMYIEPGEYNMCAFSSTYDFVLFKTEITITSTETTTVIFNASDGTVPVTVWVKDINGNALEGATVCFVLTGTTMNPFVSGTNSTGYIQVLVYPAEYHIEVWKSADEAYYLYKTNVVVTEAASVTFEPAFSTVGVLYLNLDEVVADESSWFATWPNAISVDFSPVYSPSTVVFTPDTYHTWIQIEVTGSTWQYDLGGSQMTFTPGSSLTFDFGGYLNLTIRTEESYAPGSTAEIVWNLTDAYQHEIERISAWLEGTASVEDLVKTGSCSLLTGWEEMYPRLEIIDPHGHVLINETIADWWSKRYNYFLPPDASAGTYSVRISLDTGPYDGVLVAEDYFTVECTRSLVYVDPAENIFYAGDPYGDGYAVVGDNFTVNISSANWSEPGVFSYEFKLFYNNSLLKAVAAGIPEDHWLKPETSGNILIVDNGTIHHEEGYITFGATLLGPEPGETGGGVIGTVTFEITTAPTIGQSLSCNLELGDFVLVDPNADLIPSENYYVEHGIYQYTFPAPTLSVSPAYTTVRVGEEFTVDVTLDFAEDLYAFEFWLSFNNSVLNATAVDYTGYLNEPTNELYREINNTGGYVSLAVSSQHPASGKTGGGVLATIHFKSLAVGGSTLHLYETHLFDDQTVEIPHKTRDDQVTVTFTNLLVSSVVVEDEGCIIYANDIYANGTACRVPVEVTVENVGVAASGSFNVSLTVYWINGSQQEDFVEWRVQGLSAGENTTLTYNWRPMHTGYYNLKVVVDCNGEVAESDEGDNPLTNSDFPVALIGDVNCDGTVGIVDAVVVSLAWASSPESPNWNLCADLNHDGVVNIGDGVRICLHWNQTW